MKSSIVPVTKVLLFAWSVVYLGYTLLVVWAATGPHALAGPSTAADYVVAGLWLLFSIVQLAVVLAWRKHDKPWLIRTAIILAALSVGSVTIAPILALMYTG